MIDKLIDWFDRHRELPTLRRVVVAVSGGVDSMVAMDLIGQLSGALGFSVVVCHVDHRMRPESEDEQRFVEAEAVRRGLTFHGVAVDVPGRIRATGESPQAAARALRYEALTQCAREAGAEAVVLAHHQDDQAETVLLRLLRGASPTGLGGMNEVRRSGDLWWLRPFLKVTKAELVAYAADHGIPYREDPSNWSTKYLRNKIRLQLIPLLETDYQPRVKDHLARLAQMIQEDEAVLTSMALEARDRCVRVGSGNYRIDIPRFSDLPAALQRRVLTLILDYPSERLPGWGAIQVEALRNLALHGRSGSELRLSGGWRARRVYDELVFDRFGEEGRPIGVGPLSASPIPLSVPGRTSCPILGVTIDATVVSRQEWELRARAEAANDPGVGPSTPAVADFDWERMEGRPLFIRSRLPGDRFAPFGLGGTKKIKDVWIDDKVPRELRDRWPLLAAGREILWIIGWRRSAHWPVTKDTQRILHVEATWTNEEIREWVHRRTRKN
ncbi:tRNA lysidine(34) synthetase TilS [Kyrpidia sp.]|uniref:tRNA lysidine(34) synthetase TilS n=1 Tax=Kyrpidia sp. TaxID=2073077 RepID=UPI00258321B2|nr:tRNA lysidine(34) synthetase TilS [Kyrpidia sp.]MCL6576390.1 tRNA lysidine(34) synthetase TilS [Kyrpidia sp.]